MVSNENAPVVPNRPGVAPAATPEDAVVEVLAALIYEAEPRARRWDVPSWGDLLARDDPPSATIRGGYRERAAIELRRVREAEAAVALAYRQMIQARADALPSQPQP